MSHLHANLNRIKSGYNAQKESVTLVSSKRSNQILDLFQASGYITSWYQKTPREVGVRLKYVQNSPAIKNISIISTPSNEVYLSFAQCVKIQNTAGVLILDTKGGYIFLKDALSQQIGGKAVCFLR